MTSARVLLAEPLNSSPVDILKIDIVFVTAQRCRASGSACDFIIDCPIALGLHVIAEGNRNEGNSGSSSSWLSERPVLPFWQACSTIKRLPPSTMPYAVTFDARLGSPRRFTYLGDAGYGTVLCLHTQGILSIPPCGRIQRSSNCWPTTHRGATGR